MAMDVTMPNEFLEILDELNRRDFGVPTRRGSLEDARPEEERFDVERRRLEEEREALRARITQARAILLQGMRGLPGGAVREMREQMGRDEARLAEIDRLLARRPRGGARSREQTQEKIERIERDTEELEEERERLFVLLEQERLITDMVQPGLPEFRRAVKKIDKLERAIDELDFRIHQMDVEAERLVATLGEDDISEEVTGGSKESRQSMLEKRLRIIEDEIHAIEKGLPKPSKEANAFWESHLERLHKIAERLEKALESNMSGKGKHSPIATELMRRRHELYNYIQGLKEIASLPPTVASSPAMLALIQEANEYISKAQKYPLDPDNVRELRPKGKGKYSKLAKALLTKNLKIETAESMLQELKSALEDTYEQISYLNDQLRADPSLRDDRREGSVLSRWLALKEHVNQLKAHIQTMKRVRPGTDPEANPVIQELAHYFHHGTLGVKGKGFMDTMRLRMALTHASKKENELYEMLVTTKPTSVGMWESYKDKWTKLMRSLKKGSAYREPIDFKSPPYPHSKPTPAPPSAELPASAPEGRKWGTRPYHGRVGVDESDMGLTFTR